MVLLPFEVPSRMLVLMDSRGNCWWEGKWSGEPMATGLHGPTQLKISTDVHCTEIYALQTSLTRAILFHSN